MKKAYLLALAGLLVAACNEAVKVTFVAPGAGEAVYGVDTVFVNCQPQRAVEYVELLIDSAVAGRDSFPSYLFEWDVRHLAENGTHRLQARAFAGGREYLSNEIEVTVGFRSRLVTNGESDSASIHLPDGRRERAVELRVRPRYARLTAGCSSIVFISARRLYAVSSSGGEPELLAEAENGIYNCDAAPYGTLVAYEAFPAGTAHLFIVDAASGDTQQLTHDGDEFIIDSSRFTTTGNSNPVFSPDGRMLAYFRQSICLVPGDPHENETRQDVFLVDLNGTGLVNMTAGLENGYFWGFTWTFDGKWVLFNLGSSAEAVLAVNAAGRVVSLPALGNTAQALACSPTDSSLMLCGPDGQFYRVQLSWNQDTLLQVGQSSGIGFGAGKDLDWVRFP